jgi:hypothetical protein
MKSSLYKLKSKIYTSPTDAPLPPAILTDQSRYQMTGAFTSITQLRTKTGVVYQSCNGATSRIAFPAATSKQCNFTSESFTVAVWAYSANIGSAQYLICQGATDVDGWGLFLFMNNISFRLNQGGSHTDISAVNAFRYNYWNLIGVTRTGNTGQFYVNGKPVTTIGGGGLVNAVSCNGGNKLLMGIADGEVLNAYEGSFVGHRILLGAMTQEQMAKMFEAERRL